MAHTGSLTLIMTLALAGCVATPQEDGSADNLLSGDRADSCGVAEGSPEARGVLQLANTGLSDRAADNIRRRRRSSRT